MFLPILVNIKDDFVTIIGGGKISLRKTLKILEFGGRVNCISKEFEPAFKGLENVSCIQEEYRKEVLPNKGLVIAATNDKDLNERIFLDCQEINLLCLLVDNGEKSNFIFPASKEVEDIIISVSTKGKKPAKAKNILNKIIFQYIKETNNEN